MSDDDGGKVVPFRRERPGPDYRLHPSARRGTQGARDLAAQQTQAQHESYASAALGQADDRLIASGKVVPARITLAMNLRGVDGPDVDVHCGTFEGNPAGDVDAWEAGTAVPSADQVRLMAGYVDFPVPWFYRPMKPGPLIANAAGEPGWVFMCGPGGCTVVRSDWVDEFGVLHYGDDADRPVRDGQVQISLPILGGDPAPAASSPRKKAAQTRKKTPAAAAQPALPTSSKMPAHLRAELEAKLAERRGTPPT